MLIWRAQKIKFTFILISNEKKNSYHSANCLVHISDSNLTLRILEVQLAFLRIIFVVFLLFRFLHHVDYINWTILFIPIPMDFSIKSLKHFLFYLSASAWTTQFWPPTMFKQTHLIWLSDYNCLIYQFTFNFLMWDFRRIYSICMTHDFNSDWNCGDVFFFFSLSRYSCSSKIETKIKIKMSKLPLQFHMQLQFNAITFNRFQYIYGRFILSLNTSSLPTVTMFRFVSEVCRLHYSHVALWKWI